MDSRGFFSTLEQTGKAEPLRFFMHLHVSDVFALVSFPMVMFLFALVEAVYPLWCEAQVFGKRVPREERVKRVSKAYERGTGGSSSSSSKR
jgi:hypothetical protein